MSRRMSCSMTVDAVRDRSKTVTRRHVDTWRTLAPGDRLTLIEKGMGLAKGEKQVVLAEVEVVGVAVEPLSVRSINPLLDRRYAGGPSVGRPHVTVDDGECVAEGLGEMSPVRFVEFWAGAHGYPKVRWSPGGQGFTLVAEFSRSVECRRIEWRYL